MSTIATQATETTQATTAEAAATAAPQPAESAAETAARTSVPPPENIAVEAIMPTDTKPVIPKPTTAELAAQSTSAQPAGHADKAMQIEKYLAEYLRDRLPANLAQGLMVDVILANSNAVTALENAKGEHDILIKLHGGTYSEELDTTIRTLVKNHPGLGASDVQSAVETTGGQKGSYGIMVKSLGLNANQIAHLLTAHPVQHGTPVIPTKDEAPAEAAPSAPAADQPATDNKSELAAAPAVDQVTAVQSSTPENLQVPATVPATTVEAPAANAEKLESKQLVANGVAV